MEVGGIIVIQNVNHEMNVGLQVGVHPGTPVIVPRYTVTRGFFCISSQHFFQERTCSRGVLHSHLYINLSFLFLLWQIPLSRKRDFFFSICLVSLCLLTQIYWKKRIKANY